MANSPEYLSDGSTDYEMRQRQRAIFYQRCLVLSSYLSFFVFVITASCIFLHATISTIVPHWVVQVLVSNRDPLLIVSFVCFIACYLTLRYITNESMSGPERYLDERQRMVRDRAHRTAYRIITSAFLLIVLGFFAFKTFVPTPTQPQRTPFGSVYTTTGIVIPHIIEFYPQSSKTNVTSVGTIVFGNSIEAGSPNSFLIALPTSPSSTPQLKTQSIAIATLPSYIYMVTPPDSIPTDLLNGTLLFPFFLAITSLLFLAITSLPRSIVAWSERI